LLDPERCDRDGVLDPGEDCDDGNDSAEDACTNECFVARCGDAIVRRDLRPGESGYEDCDTGADNGIDHCRFDCVLATRPRRIAATDRMTCVVRRDTLKCWGNTTAPEPRPLPGELIIGATPFHILGLAPLLPTTMLVIDTRLIAWGPASPLLARTPPTGAGFPWSHALAAGLRAFRGGIWSDRPDAPGPGPGGLWSENACHIDSQGRVACRGHNACGQLDDSMTPSPDVWVAIDTAPARAVAVARNALCSAGIDGRVSCWGDTTNWGDPDGECMPAAPALLADIDEVVALSADSQSFIGLRRDGTVVRWGRVIEAVEDGVILRRLGAPETFALPEPAVQIASAEGSHCAILRSGAVACWGRWDGGHGDGQAHIMANLNGVTELTDYNFASHFCAIAEGGKVWCWGRNENSQLGNYGTEPVAQPTAVYEQQH
jgi:hypothetical protein